MHEGEESSDDVGLVPALRVDPADPEVERARAAVEARLLGVPHEPLRIGRFVVLERLGAGGMGIVYAAFDPQLDRRVAIKLLFARDSLKSEQARLVGEAKAMAKLAHPHVVHVYEVGAHRGQLFVAMEHVRGRTLFEWCHDAPRTTAEVLRVCMQAGEGLAAAHAAGIVHRDFKPDNVIVGDERGGPRARVLDFGLARAIVEPTESDLEDASIEITVAATGGTGARAGTPGYAAPEQLRGEAADPGTDQFSFCATVWEALTGALPFAPAELLAAVQRGKLESPPRTKMPAWIERALRRGLLDDPRLPNRGRWPHLDDLLRALARDPAVVRRRRVGTAAVALGIAGAFAVGSTLRSDATDDPCADGTKLLEAAWSKEEQQDALARMVEQGGKNAPAAVSGLKESIGKFSLTWLEAHRETCLAHERGEQSDDLFERRNTCLDRSRKSFTAFGRLLREARGTELGRIAASEAGIVPPTNCTKLQALPGVTLPPVADASSFNERYADIYVRFVATATDTADVDAAQLLVEARAMGYPTLVADALELHAMITLERGNNREAALEFREATTLALANGDDRKALYTWSNGARAVALAERVTADIVFDGYDFMAAIAERYAEDGAARDFYSRVGGMELGRGRKAAAHAAFARAIEIATAHGGAGIAYAYQGIALSSDDPAEREHALERAIALAAEEYGPDHARTIDMRKIAGMNHPDDRKSLELVSSACADRHIQQPDNDRADAQCEHSIVMLAQLVGDQERARLAAERWAAAASYDKSVATATLALFEGDAAKAASTLAAEVAADDATRDKGWPWYELLNHGEAELVLGRAWRMLADPRADDMLAHALADLEHGASVMAQPYGQRRVALARKLIADEPLR